VTERFGLAGYRHDAFRHSKAAGLCAEPRRGEQQQRLARLRGGCAHLRPATMDRRARRGGALVRRQIGIERDSGELAHVEIELLAGDLQQASGVALAELALAEEHGGGIVRMHGDPAVYPTWIGWARDSTGRRRGALRQARHGKADDEGAAF
jgi:hypothetical protein